MVKIHYSFLILDKKDSFIQANHAVQVSSLFNVIRRGANMIRGLKHKERSVLH